METIEAGVVALYSGDADRAAELFELYRTDEFSLHTLTDDGIREEAAYQAAIGGRLTLNCTEQATPGEFSCLGAYHNALSDAIHHRDIWDRIGVVVEDGVITEFGFPEHSFLLASWLAYLEDNQLEDHQVCNGSRDATRTPDCANLMLDNLDDWASWYQTNN